MNNCWEFKDCGRQARGPKVNDLGVCPAAIDISSDGLNRGENGGRVCWAIAGTFCDGKVQGTYAQKGNSCLACDFFRMVNDEELGKFDIIKPTLLKA